MSVRKLAVATVLVCVTTACMQTENSSSQDAEVYSELEGRPGFTAARAIFTQNCSGCHAYHTMSEDQMVASGVLKIGDPANSKLYYRLTGSAEGPGPKNMPTGGSLSANDLRLVQTWIKGL